MARKLLACQRWLGWVKETKILSILPHGVHTSRHLPHRENNRTLCDPQMFGNFSHLLHVLKNVRERLVLLVLQQELLKLNGLDQ